MLLSSSHFEDNARLLTKREESKTQRMGRGHDTERREGRDSEPWQPQIKNQLQIVEAIEDLGTVKVILLSMSPPAPLG